MRIFSVLGKAIKYLLISLLLIIVLLITILGLAFLYYPPETIISTAARAGLKWYGVEKQLHLTIKQSNSNKFIAENIDLGDPKNFSITYLEIDYSLAALLRQKIDKVIIQGLTITGVDSDNDNVFTFGNLDNLWWKKIFDSQFNLLLRFLLPEVKTVIINQSEIALHKSDQKISVPFEFSSVNNQNTYYSKINFTKADVNLNKLAIPGVGEITIISKLTGEVPFLFDKRRVTLKNGEIFSLNNGIIRFKSYNPAVNNSFLYKLFSDFQYKTLSAKIEVGEKDIIKFNFQFDGSNKDFYKGQRVKLNINLNISEKDLNNYLNLMIRLKQKNIKK
ncbi:MAG: YdbH domain-containing protein [Gammaproteobacteria bacterium]|nr:YdbH domain-containing protein [Gammaproteobacteria bacterium]